MINIPINLKCKLSKLTKSNILPQHIYAIICFLLITVEVQLGNLFRLSIIGNQISNTMVILTAQSISVSACPSLTLLSWKPDIDVKANIVLYARIFSWNFLDFSWSLSNESLSNNGGSFNKGSFILPLLQQTENSGSFLDDRFNFSSNHNNAPHFVHSYVGSPISLYSAAHKFNHRLWYNDK